ncbi:MAG: mucoidy inhibitor MuiA family protein [Planctomycetota bacterium]
MTHANRFWTALLLVSIAAIGAALPPTQARAQPGARADPDDAFRAQGEVRQVTLFGNSARVTRQVETPPVRGPIEVRVTNLPPAVVAHSLFAVGQPGVTVRGVRFVSRTERDPLPQEQIDALEARETELRDELARTGSEMAALGQAEATLDHFNQGVISAAGHTASRGASDKQPIDPRATIELIAFIREQRQEIAAARVELEIVQRQAEAQLAEVEAEKREARNTPTRTRREAVVYLDQDAADAGRFELTYAVAHAGWSPAYVVRGATRSAGPDADPLGRHATPGSTQLARNAVIRQATGEDWTNVRLTLSTAEPGQNAAAPVLLPLYVQLVAMADSAARMAGASLGDALATNRARRADIDRFYANADGVAQANEFGVTQNTLGSQAQVYELAGRGRYESQRDAAGLAQSIPIPLVVEQLGGAVSLRSREDPQLVQIATHTLAADYYHLAMPVISDFVYREAALVNDTGVDLLAGPVDTFLDGVHVGRSQLPTVAPAQHFRLGFGADPELRTARNLVQRNSRNEGGNTVRTFQYELVVENLGDSPRMVRLLERLPHPNESVDIRVELLEGFDQLSQAEDAPDPEDQGVLRFDLVAQPGAVADQAARVAYAYQLTFDKSLNLAEAQADAQAIQRRYQDGALRPAAR